MQDEPYPTEKCTYDDDLAFSFDIIQPVKDFLCISFLNQKIERTEQLINMKSFRTRSVFRETAGSKALYSANNDGQQLLYSFVFLADWKKP